MRYKIRIGEKTYDLSLDNHQPKMSLLLEGKPVDFDLELIQEPGLYSLILDGRQYRVWIEGKGNGSYQLRLNHDVLVAEVEDERQALRKAMAPAKPAAGQLVQVKAPMPGLVVKVEVAEGEDVQQGQGLAVIEAMKMENEIRSPISGVVKKVHIREGQTLEKDALLFEIGTPEKSEG